MKNNIVNKRNKFCFLILFFSLNIHCQTFFGTVKDTLGVPLQNANVIAEPIEEGEELSFSITDHLGRYRLKLEKDVSYTITISYIGYITKTYRTVVNFSKKEYHFILKQKEELLNEIVIKYKHAAPIIVKKDTLIYDVNSFKNGKEFKMIEVLEKMPGFEVEENGTVKVQGKKVTKMLVENKPFFGGSTKLAIENIPADALDKIEVIDNFNEVAFLKQVSDSKDMIINVKLKKNKKEFVFGDVEAGAEIAEDNGFYSLHSALFSYNKRTNLSFIGDLNNIGKRSFSFEDVMRFQNVKSSFIDSRKNQTNLSNFARDNSNVLRSKSQFSALNTSFELSSKLTIDSYGIFSKLSTVGKEEEDIKYLQVNSFSSENRIYDRENKELLAIGSLKLNYSPSVNSRVVYNFQFQNSVPEEDEEFKSIFNNQLMTLQTKEEAHVNELKQFLEWHKKYNNKHITTFVFNQNYQNKREKRNWLSNNPILNQYIPFEKENVYNLNQIKRVENNTIDALIKHYWVAHDLHHFYFNVGNNLEITNLKTSEQQLLSNNMIVDFSNNKFGNDIKYFLNDFYIGLEYKFKIKKWENKLSLYNHFFSLMTQQTDNYRINTLLIEPKWNSEYEFNPTENLALEYKFSNEFPNANQFLEQFTLINYNTIFKGNSLLRNEKFHNAKLRYSKYNMYKGLIIRADVDYNKKIRTIRNQLKLTGIDQFITPVITNNPEINLKVSGMLEKQVNKFRLSFRASLRWFDFIQTINDRASINQSNNQNLEFKIRTADKKLPRIGIRYKKIFSQFNGLTNSSLTSDRIKLNTSTDFLKSFTFKANFEVTYAKNQNDQINRYQIANASLNYKKRNYPLSFEVSAQNFLNNNLKINNSFSDFIISSNKTYTLPRIVMFTFRYKI